METDLLELFPHPGGRVALRGLYLAHALRARGPDPYVCSNFIVSLDGRIALTDPVTGLQRVPPAIANPRDWRLYLEIAAQADVLLTTGRHLRAVAAGRHRDLLAVADQPDLRAWRLARGLPSAPAVAALSATLAFPTEALEQLPGPLLVFTTDSAPVARERELRARGVGVQCLGGTLLDGGALVAALAGAGHRVIYSIAGPRVLHALCAARALHRLYLTQAMALLGGEPLVPLLHGPELDRPVQASLAGCYLDTAAQSSAGTAQLFCTYDLNHAG